jgi:hypothetical protein
VVGGQLAAVHDHRLSLEVDRLDLALNDLDALLAQRRQVSPNLVRLPQPHLQPQEGRPEDVPALPVHQDDAVLVADPLAQLVGRDDSTHAAPQDDRGGPCHVLPPWRVGTLPAAHR